MIRVEEIGPDQSQLVFDLVARLLDELGDPTETAASLNHEKIRGDWKYSGERFTTFVAFGENEIPLGIITLSEHFAIYANGIYGVINEIYVAPEFRGKNIGKMLIQTAKEFGDMRGWERIDVTTPQSDKPNSAIEFYEREGFSHTGVKLKYVM